MNITEFRKQYGWSKSELARRLGVTYKTVLRWESGATRPSSMAQKLLKEIEAQEGSEQ